MFIVLVSASPMTSFNPLLFYFEGILKLGVFFSMVFVLTVLGIILTLLFLMLWKAFVTLLCSSTLQKKGVLFYTVAGMPCLAQAMRSEDASQHFFADNIVATSFLMWCGLILVPRLCPRGHPFQINHSGIRCRRPMPDSYEADSDNEMKRKKNWCDLKVSHRTPETFLHACPDNTKPTSFATWMFWFAELATLKRMRTEADISTPNCAACVKSVQKVMWWSLQQALTDEKWGGPGLIVCMDCTFFTKKKRSRSGFQGRTTAGHTVCVLGLVEIDMVTRKETGKAMLLQVPGEQKDPIRRAVLERVHRGSLVFTDKHQSYAWLAAAGYVHRAVNHKKREFSRDETIFGVLTKVTTNPAEGLFGRCKAFARSRGIKKLGKDCYGLLLAEFVWRSTNLSARSEWRDAPIFAILDLLVQYQTEALHPNIVDPAKVSEETAATLSQFKESMKAAAPPPPPQVAPVVPLPAPPDEDPALHRRAALPPRAARPTKRRRTDLLPVLPIHSPRRKEGPRTANVVSAIPSQAVAEASPPSFQHRLFPAGDSSWHHSLGFGIVTCGGDGKVHFPPSSKAPHGFSVSMAYSSGGRLQLGDWILDEEASTLDTLVWNENTKTQPGNCVWRLLRSEEESAPAASIGSAGADPHCQFSLGEASPTPSPARKPARKPREPPIPAWEGSPAPWVTGQVLRCMYPSKALNWEPILRQVTITGYKDFPKGPAAIVDDGGPIKCKTYLGRPSQFHIRCLTKAQVFEKQCDSSRW